MPRVVGVVLQAFLVVGLLATPPVAAQDLPVFVDAATYLAMFDEADLRGVEQPADEVYDLFIEITGDRDLDQRIRDAAEARGYVRRPVATGPLVAVGRWKLQPAAADAWVLMVEAAQADGVSLALTSAHRDLAAQQTLFRRRLAGGSSDAAVERTLRMSAPPGYSKHHSGYAIDIGQAGGTEAGFVNTKAYTWLSEFDFARAKLFGFIPSYPVGGEGMGPDPEAWEFVWVGVGRIACAADGSLVAGFCDVGTDRRLDDISWMIDLGITVGCAPERFCPDDPISRGEAASLLWRLHGAPTPTATAPFVDIFADDHYRSAVDWLWSTGVVAGTSALTFSPEDALRPSEGLAVLLRLEEIDDRPPPEGLRGPAPDFSADALVIGDLGTSITRAEFASALRAATGV